MSKNLSVPSGSICQFAFRVKFTHSLDYKEELEHLYLGYEKVLPMNSGAEAVEMSLNPMCIVGSSGEDYAGMQGCDRGLEGDFMVRVVR